MELLVIQRKIYEIRGQKVMLDYDLSELYETETKYLKSSVMQNIKRFPSDFMFALTRDEWETLRCSFSTSNTRGGTRYMPFAFTEQGFLLRSPSKPCARPPHDCSEGHPNTHCFAVKTPLLHRCKSLTHFNQLITSLFKTKRVSNKIII